MASVNQPKINGGVSVVNMAQNKYTVRQDRNISMKANNGPSMSMAQNNQSTNVTTGVTTTYLESALSKPYNANNYLESLNKTTQANAVDSGIVENFSAVASQPLQEAVKMAASEVAV